ncbi:hypothetical protein [Streptomyces sp. NBC_00083]|uniref:hypothetical protein n=1 Tax=Streptomyces sp. NBC_00083 TaxID=2975647 RepID=UPI00225056AF|nr:hypothetical protein [Streptomyces sp. NBC_00083]MCX5384216.1 hypothetical protein [Streptomyces sp. NBC_00083]
MNRKHLWMVTGGVTAAVALLSACSGSGGGSASGSTPSASASAAHPVDAVSAKEATADKVKSAMEARLSVDEPRFGSGGKSPCSTASAEVFTQKCADATQGTNADASFALAQISGKDGFATLRSVAEKLQKAAATYQELGCATNPAKAATRQACLGPAAVVAQGFPDLRDGANLGLAGK